MAPKESTKDSLQRASNPIPDSFFSTLITANHILHKNSIVDAYGHISARNPRDHSTFFLSASVAPALVSTRADILEYRVLDGSAVDASTDRKSYLERFIHSEMYKAYQDVQSVVHAHSEAVLPFSITSVPLRPVFHMGGVLGTQAPVFDIALHYTGSDRQDLLVPNERLGSALAASMNPGTVVSRTKNLIQNIYSRPAEHAPPWPSHPVVLMRGHGFTAVGGTIEEAVYRAVYTVTNAKVQLQACLLQGGYNVGLVGEQMQGIKIDGGKGRAPDTKAEGVKYLSERECKEAWEANKTQASRPWGLWVREVEASGLYVNEYLTSPEEDEEQEAEE